MKAITHVEFLSLPPQRAAKSFPAPSRARIRVDGKPVGTLRFSSIQRLGLHVGVAWTPELAREVEKTLQLEKALDKIMGWMNRRWLSVAETEKKLAKAGFNLAIRKEALAAAGFVLGDRALAAQLTEDLVCLGSAGPELVRQRLEKRLIPQGIIEEALTQWCSAPKTMAQNAARGQLKKVPAGKNRTSERRRLAGFLARKGFEELVVEDVVNELLPEVEE